MSTIARRVVQSAYLSACIAIWVWVLGATPDPLIDAWSHPVRTFMSPLAAVLNRIDASSGNAVIAFILRTLVGMVGILLLPGLLIVGLALSVAWLFVGVLLAILLVFALISLVLWDFWPVGKVGAVAMFILGVVCAGAMAVRGLKEFRGHR